MLTGIVSGATHERESDLSLGMGARTWIGMQSCNRGYRLRHTYFGNEGIDLRPVVPINSESAFNKAYYLSSDTVDLEVTQLFCFCKSNIEATFGGRYARLERNSTVVGYGTVGNGVGLFGFAMDSNEIEDSGFIFSLSTFKPLRCHCG